ncbi:MAG: hypothetical protein Q9221_001789 [Calogaya cf. arnoldii]
MDTAPEEMEINVDDLTYGLVSCSVPEFFRNPHFAIVFPNRSAYDSISDFVPVTLADGLGDVINSDQPPATEFFLSLPRPSDVLLWGVYALVMHKPNLPFKLYIGSGTNATTGVLSRLSSYHPDCSNLPRFVKKAFEDGYTLLHIGLLLSTPLPTAGLVHKARGLMMAMEALMAFIFHAGFTAVTDDYLSEYILWPRNAVDWEPLCSHNCLNEAIRGDLQLTQEELELAAQLRQARIKETTAEFSWAYRKRKREEDELGFRHHRTNVTKAWQDRNQSKTLKTAEKSRAKAKESRRFLCTDCDMTFVRASALENHYGSTAHHNQVNGVVKGPSHKDVANRQAKRIQAINEKTFYCSACDKAFGGNGELTRHEASKLHEKRLLKHTQDSP